MGSKRFWLSLNVLLAGVQFAVVAAWIQITSAGMGLAAESNGIYSYFRDAELFKIIVATSKNETYSMTYWPGVVAAVVLCGVLLTTVKLWNAPAKS